VIQAMSGMMDLTGEPDGRPMLSGMFIPDHLTGLWAALSVSFALLRRARTGAGSFTDLSMLDALVSFHASAFMEVLDHGETLTRVGSKVRGSYASTYPTKDGWIYLAPLTQRMWQAVSDIVGRPDLATYFPAPEMVSDTRLAHREYLDRIIEAWTRARTSDEAVATMRAAGVAAAPVYTINDLIGDPHLQAREMLRTIPDVRNRGTVHVPGSPIPATAASFTVAPPDISEHTDEILRELGLAGDGHAREPQSAREPQEQEPA
jgi:crotonobetainyl-CoA:carnitine CoA-transferase CaiB-like acyl-CoA transferase